MEKDILQLISTNYLEILPQNRETLLLLVWLNQKIDNGNIEEEFTTRDFEEAIEEISDFLHEDKSIQKETLSKKISGYFYETIPKGKGYRIQLTVYTKNLCKLLVHRIKPEIQQLELIHTFKRTLPLTDKDLENIQTFKYWFDNHFLTARNQILQHTEVLQQTVEERINELRTLLRPNIENPKELIGQFDKIFEDLAKQATGLANTIDFKNETLRKIKATKDLFTQDTETFNQFDKMQREVDTFFDNISRRISGINEKIQLASRRLRNLLDTLRHKQQFKINLEKFLQLLLVNGKNIKGEIVLPTEFPRRQIPSQLTKYLAIPKIDFQIHSLAEPERPEVDKEYYQKQEAKNLLMLNNQEQTAKWLDRIDTEVQAGNEVRFEEWMDKIIDAESNLEVPIQVCYGLILGSKKEKKQKLVIEQEPAPSSQNDLQLWKMKIHPTRS